MRLNAILLCVLAIGLGGAIAAVYATKAAKNSEIAKLKQEIVQFESLQQELEELRAQVASREQQDIMSEGDKQELIRLRGEVTQLRRQEKELTREVETTKAQAQAAKAEREQVVQSMSHLARSNAVMRASLATGQAVPIARSDAKCINNLRQIDGAKQQWALEHQKDAQAMPSATDLAPYFPAGVIPVCPDTTATYSFNTVGQLPTCSNPSHKLPPPVQQ